MVLFYSVHCTGIKSSVTIFCAAFFRNSTSAAATNGNHKIIISLTKTPKVQSLLTGIAKSLLHTRDDWIVFSCYSILSCF